MSARMAANAGVDMIFVDDGMQHRRLVRDFDVVILDAADPFGRGFFLPRGFSCSGIHPSESPPDHHQPCR